MSVPRVWALYCPYCRREVWDSAFHPLVGELELTTRLLAEANFGAPVVVFELRRKGHLKPVLLLEHACYVV